MGEETREQALEMLRAPETASSETAEPRGAAAEKPAGKDAGSASAAPAPDAGGDKGKAAETAAGAEPAPAAGEQGGDGWVRAFDSLKAELGERCGSAEQLKAQVADAHALYDICFGKAEPTGLLNLLKEMYPEAYAKVAAHFAPEGAAGKPGEKPTAGAPPADGTAKDVQDLKAWREKEERGREERETNARRMRVVDGFHKKLDELAKQAGLDDAEKEEYGFLISQQIGRDPEMLKRLEAGKHADLEKLFNERHTLLNERFKKRSDALIKDKQARDRSIPKSPAGGSPPAPAAGPKVDLTDRDARTAAALELFRQPTT